MKPLNEAEFQECEMMIRTTRRRLRLELDRLRLDRGLKVYYISTIQNIRSLIQTRNYWAKRMRVWRME